MKVLMWCEFFTIDCWTFPIDAKNTKKKNTYQVRSTDVMQDKDP